MNYKPHAYQRYAIDWIIGHPICALFLDCGLGKTSVTLTALQTLIYDRFEVSKVLVIAPLRVARDVWKEEAEKWDHLKDLRLSIVTGDREAREAALRADADIYVINRENVPWLMEKSGCSFDFDTVVIDELSSFKNHQASRYKALARKRKNITRMIGLTGTPAPNGLEDIWSEFRLLDQGERLGKYITHFRLMYEVPDKRAANMIYSYKPLPGAVKAVSDKIADVTVSMNASDYLEMPELLSLRTVVRMNPSETRDYKDFKEDYVLSVAGEEVTAANAAALAGKLSQLANGAIYDDEHVTRIFHDRKLEALADLIESLNGQPVLIAYWFRHDRERIEKMLREMPLMWSALDEPEALEAWNEGKLNVGLIHPASAGHGLNLQTGGHYLIWFGLTWSLELYQQTNARLWRQGQRSRTVIIQHIVTAGTIDERILRAIEKKDMSQSVLIDAVKANL